MKVLSRDFSTREKIIILILIIIVLILAYYQFFDKSIREDLESARLQKEALELEYQQVQQELAELNSMQAEVDSVKAGKHVSQMESYNASDKELKILNDILDGTENYSITFANVTREKNQIRRNFTLTFTAPNYQRAVYILTQLSHSPSRCLLADLRLGATTGNLALGAVNVNTTATFYETMVDGVADAGLPVDTAEAQ